MSDVLEPALSCDCRLDPVSMHVPEKVEGFRNSSLASVVRTYEYVELGRLNGDAV